MSKLNVAVVGYGTIGSGVIEILQDLEKLIEKRSQIDVRLKYVVDKDFESPRSVEVLSAKKETDYKVCLNDPDIDVIVELVGGIGFAYTLIEESLKAGKHVVTANKALLAEKGEPLFQLAREKNLAIGFGASVCGGIPIIRTISDALMGDQILSIYGIVNGTTNYILTRMIEDQMDFNVALKKAQELGFAEADPTLDIDGFDAAHKAALLAAVAFNTVIDYEKIYVEGIRGIQLEDVENASELGYVVKLLAISRLCGDKTIEARVNPTLVPKKSQLAAVQDEYNAALVESQYLGTSMYYGKGAGSRPTATAVVSDILDIARFQNRPEGIMKLRQFNHYPVKPMEEIVSRFYIRLTVKDQVGVLKTISGIFADHEISIASLIQKEQNKDDYVPLVLTTHQAKEKSVKQALVEIEKKSFCSREAVVLRMME